LERADETAGFWLMVPRAAVDAVLDTLTPLFDQAT